jgi:hypothetical protein
VTWTRGDPSHASAPRDVVRTDKEPLRLAPAFPPLRPIPAWYLGGPSEPQKNPHR